MTSEGCIHGIPLQTAERSDLPDGTFPHLMNGMSFLTILAEIHLPPVICGGVSITVGATRLTREKKAASGHGLQDSALRQDNISPVPFMVHTGGVQLKHLQSMHMQHIADHWI